MAQTQETVTRFVLRLSSGILHESFSDPELGRLALADEGGKVLRERHYLRRLCQLVEWLVRLPSGVRYSGA